MKIMRDLAHVKKEILIQKIISIIIIFFVMNYQEKNRKSG